MRRTDLHFCPRVLHGPGVLQDLPDQLDTGSTFLLVTDPGVAGTGLADRVVGLLDEAGIACAVFDRVCIDPDITVVEAAVELARQTRCDSVIGLGGGSSLDAAKAVAARMAWPSPLVDYGRGQPVPAPIAPLVAIPTTAGTGSEATRVAVITDPVTQEKMALRGDALLPRLSILDPELLRTLPAHTAAECGADALTHAIEARVSRQATGWTNTLAVAAIGLIGAHLPRLVADRTDEEAASQMMIAANLAGQAFTHAGLGLVHSLAEPLGAFHHTSHGLSCALFLPVVMEFNQEAAAEGYAEVARALGAADALTAVRELLARAGLPASYAEAGVDFELREDMVRQALPQFSTTCNPREATHEDVVRLFSALVTAH